MRSCIYTLKWNRTKGKHKNVQKGGKKPLLCTFRSTHSSNIILGLSGMNSCLSLLSITLSHGNRVTGHLTVGITRPEYTENTKHVLYHYPGHYSLLTGKKKTLWLHLQIKPTLFASTPSRPSGMWSICDSSQGIYCLNDVSVTVWAISARNLSSSKLQTKEKAKGIIHNIKVTKVTPAIKTRTICDVNWRIRHAEDHSVVPLDVFPTILNICSSFQKSFNSSFSDRTRLFVLWRVCLSLFVCLLQKNVHAW